MTANSSRPRYPVHLDVTSWHCLVVGGGAVAERRVRGLTECGAYVLVISPSLTDGLRALQSEGLIACSLREYVPSDVSGCRLVIAATDSTKVNAGVCADARALGIACSNASKFADGDFIVPKVVRRGALCISVSTDGASPQVAGAIGKQIEQRYGAEWEAFVDLLSECRQYIQAETTQPEARRRALKRVVDAEAELSQLAVRDFAAARVRANGIADNALRKLRDSGAA